MNKTSEHRLISWFVVTFDTSCDLLRLCEWLDLRIVA